MIIYVAFVWFQNMFMLGIPEKIMPDKILMI